MSYAGLLAEVADRFQAEGRWTAASQGVFERLLVLEGGLEGPSREGRRGVGWAARPLHPGGVFFKTLGFRTVFFLIVTSGVPGPFCFKFSPRG